MPLSYIINIAGLAAASIFLLQNPASKPENIAPPYTPPFTGGQCQIPYVIMLKWFRTDWNQYVYAVFGGSNASGEPNPQPDTTLRGQGTAVTGAISGIQRQVHLGGGIWEVTINGISINFNPTNKGSDIAIHKVITQSGIEDTCGNIPNPAPSESIGTNGSGTPPPNNQPPVLQYAPVVVGTGISAAAIAAAATAAAALGAAAAAISAATTIGGLATAIGDAIGAIGDFIDKKFNEEEKKREEEEEKKKKKKLFRQDLGRVQNDGMLSLVPNDTDETIELLFLDINFIEIPNTVGRYYGKWSPNRHWYDGGLGYICFYSYSFGIISSHELQYRRNTIPIPNGTYGFFYHFGLSTAYQANTQLVYNREVLE